MAHLSVTAVGDLIDLDRVDPGSFLVALERARLGSAWADEQGGVMRAEQVWPWLRRLLPAALDCRLEQIAQGRIGRFASSGGWPSRLQFTWVPQFEANPPHTPEFAIGVAVDLVLVATDGQKPVPDGQGMQTVGGDQPGRWSATATMVLRDARIGPAWQPPVQPEQPFHVTRTESVRLPRLVF